MVKATQFQNVKIPSTVHNIMYSKFKETEVKKFKPQTAKTPHIPIVQETNHCACICMCV
jgi:hypothetical protein